MAVEQRHTGWLDGPFHLRFREVLLHTLARHGLLCPVYCLMSDHLHMIWAGVKVDADQRLAAQFFRKHSNPLLAPRRWQKQPYDHLLREEERKQSAVQKVCHYIIENPVRAALVEAWQDYEFSGAVIPGYPTMNPRLDDYWEKHWRIYNELVGQMGGATP